MALNPNTKKLIQDRLSRFESPTPQVPEFDFSGFDKISNRDVVEAQPIVTPNQYEDYNEYIPGKIDPIYGDIDEERAQAQQGLELFGKAFAQSATELTLGTLEGLGYLADAPSTVYNSMQGKEEEFDNWWSKFWRENKEYMNEEWFPIYQTKAAHEGDFLDATSFAANTKNLMTTLTLMLPAMGVAKGINVLGTAAKVSPKLNKMAQAVGAGVASRAMEATMEAQQFMAGHKQELQADVAAKYKPAIEKELAELPEVTPYDLDNPNNYTAEDRAIDEAEIVNKYKTIIDSEVSAKATDGANTVFQGNAALAAVDALQFSELFKAFSTPAKTIKGKVLNLGFQMGTEAAEEGYQASLGMEALYSEKEGGKFLGPGFSERMGEYLKDGELQTAMFWGALGGGVFTAAGPLARKMVTVGENVDAAYKLAGIKKDLIGKKKIEDDAITSVIMNNAKRNNLDKMSIALNAYAQGVTDEHLAETGMTREEHEAKLARIQEDIAFVQEKKTELDANKLFEGREKAKLDYIKVQLESKNNGRLIKESKEAINEIYSELEKTGELTSDLKQLKDLEVKLNALKYNKANLNKIPSFKKNKELRDKVAAGIDKRIATLEPTLKALKESYKNNNPDGNLSNELTTTKDEELQNNQNKVQELEIVNVNTIKPKLNYYKNAEKIQKAQEELEKQSKEAEKKATKENIEKAETVEDLDGATSGVNEDTADTAQDTILKEAAKEAQDAPKTLDTRYEGRPNLFVKERNELAQKIVDDLRTVKLNSIAKQELDALVAAENVDSFQTALKNLEEQMLLGTESFADAFDIVMDYYLELDSKKFEKDSSEYVQPDNEKELVSNPEEDNTSDINYQSEQDKSADINKPSPSRSTITEYVMKKINNVWTLIKENGLLQKYKPAESMGINWNYVNSSESLKVGSDIYFVVNLDAVRHNKDKYHAGLTSAKDYINKFQVLIAQNDANGNRQIVGALQSNKDAQGALLNLRRQIYTQVRDTDQTGTLDTGLISKVEYKGTGKMNTTKGKNNPHEVLNEGEELILGIAVEKNGNTTIEAGGNHPELSGIKVGNEHSGKVFMLVTNANGTVTPVLTFTTELSKHPEKYQKVVDLLQKTNKDNWAKNREAIRKLVYLDYNYNAKDDTFKVYPDGTVYTKDQIADVLQGKVIQIATSEINRGNYNQTISEEGRLKTDLAQNHFVNANFQFDLNNVVPKGEETRREATQADITPATDIDIINEEITVKPSETSEPTDEGNIPNVPETPQKLKRPGRSNGTRPNLNINLNNLNRTSTEEFYELWDEQSETEWFKQRFGDDQNTLLAVKEGLLNIAKSGGLKAWGQFKEGMAVISSVAKTGTTYHEAFHVIAHLYLTPAQLESVLKEGSKKYNLPLTDKIAIEERIADDFMEYVMTEEAATQGLGTKIKNFFKELYWMIREQFTSNPTIAEVFHKAQYKYYKTEPFSRDVSKFDIVRNRPYNNIYEQHRRTIALADTMRKVFDTILSSRPEYASVPRKDILNVMTDTSDTGDVTYKGIEILAVDAYNTIYDTFIDQGASKEVEDNVTKMLSLFLEIADDSTVVFKELGRKAVQEFANSEGIKIKVSDKTATSFTDSAQEEGTELMEFAEEETKLEGWQIKAEEMSGKESLSKEVRKELSYIPKVDGNGNPQVDDLGFTIYQDFNELYGTLKRDLTDILDSDELLTRMEEIVLSKSYLKQLQEKIVTDDLFRTKMFVDFAKAHVEFKVVVQEREYQKDGTYKTTYKLVTANRNNVNNLLIDEWKVDFKDKDLNKTIDKDGNPVPAKLQAVEKAWTKITNRLKGKKAYHETDLQSIVNGVNYVGISITLEDMKNIYKPSVTKDGRQYSAKQNLDFFKKDLDALMNSIIGGNNPFEGTATESKTVTNVSHKVADNRFELMESSFKNIETKTVYSHQVPTFLSKFIQKFKKKNWEQTINWYTDTNFYRNSPWLSELRERESRENFKFVEIDGTKQHGFNKGTRYVDMSPKDYESTTINMFYNSGAKSYSYYRVPVLSDAPKMLFIKFRKYGAQEVIDKLYDVYQQEVARIENVKNRKKEGIDNPITNYDSPKSEKFLLLPFFNDTHNQRILRSPKSTEADIKNIIKTWLKEEASKDYNRMKELGVLGELADVDHRITNKSNKYGGSEASFHADYFYNSVLANTQITSMMSGDPAFYKPDKRNKSIYSRTVDYQKRNKQIVSPKLVLDTSASYQLTEEQAAIEGVDKITVNDEYRTIYIQDLEIPSTHAESIFNTLVENGMDESAAGEIASAYGYNNGKNINVTDAQAYITLPRYREVMIGLGRWTKRHQDMYPKLMDGTASGADLKFIMQPLKPFYFGHSKVNDLIVPVQNKNSEYLLLPQLAKGSKELTKLLDYMLDDNNKIGSANFHSAVKAGLFGQQPIDNINEAVVHTLNNDDFGLQQETPEHYLDSRSLFGTQIRKLIIADIDPNATFNLNGQELTKDELVDLYQHIIVEDLKDSYTKVADRFSNINTIQELLLEEIRDRNMGEEMEKAVEIVQRKNPLTGVVEDTFNLPLYHPLHSKRIESLLNSVFKNNVTKQKIKGGAFIQLSAFGFEKSLNLGIDEKGLQYAECKLPWWSKKHFEPLLDENGQLDIKKVPPNLLDMIGYRIPTEDKYSMLPLRVVGFLPASAGGAVMLPMEITTISGSDFDVDKLFIMMPEFEVSKDKEDIRKIEFDYEQGAQDQSKAARDNAKIDIMWQIMTNPDTFSKFIKPGGFDTLINSASRVLELEGKSDEMLPLILPSTQTELFNRNMAGRALKGIFANHNAHHAVLQFSNVSLLEPIDLGGEQLMSLHDIKSYNGKFISRNVAEFLAAAVDNAKDPVSSFLNINTYTANTVALLVRLGFPINLATTFLAQPILKQLSEKYFAEGGDLQAEAKAVRELEESLGIRRGDEINPTISTSPSLKELEGMIENETTPDNQVFILRKFLEIKESADGLNDLVRANRADTIGAGPTLAANEKLVDLQEKVLESEILTGVADLLEGVNYPMVQAFYEYGITKPTEVMGEFFPWMSDAFRKIKSVVSDSLKSGKLNEQQIEQINYELLGYLSSEFEFFDGSDRNEIVKGLVKEFNKMKEAHPKMFKDNAFLKKLIVEQAKNPQHPNRITFRNTGSMNNLEKVLVQEAWQELLESKEFSTFAEKLVKYTYYTAGFKMTPSSFSHVVPVDFYTHLKDSNGQTYNDFLRKQLDAAKINEDMYFGFTNQFFRNNAENSSFVPKVDREFKNITGSIGMMNGKPAYFIVDAADRNTNLDFLLKQSKEGNEYSPYVAYTYKGTTYLYKQIVTPGDTMTAAYVLEEKLGINNELLEYVKQLDPSSVISSNNPYVGFTREDVRNKVLGLTKVKEEQPSQGVLFDTPNIEKSETPVFDKLPSVSETPTMLYAGIGSRKTPKEIQNKMTEIAKYLESQGYTLRSGGAQGADLAFEKGVNNKKEVFKAHDATDTTRKIAKEIHPNPRALQGYILDLMARNTEQIFGMQLNKPVDFVLAWTPDGATSTETRSRATGGTGQAIDMASRKGIPVINLANEGWRDQLKSVLNKSKQPMKELSKTKQDLLESYDLIKEDMEALGIAKENIPALTDEEAGVLIKKFCK